MVGALVQVMRQRGIQGDWPAPWAVRGKTAQQPDHRVLVIQQLWRGWGYHGRKLVENGRVAWLPGLGGEAATVQCEAGLQKEAEKGGQGQRMESLQAKGKGLDSTPGH